MIRNSQDTEMLLRLAQPHHIRLAAEALGVEYGYLRRQIKGTKKAQPHAIDEVCRVVRDSINRRNELQAAR